MKSKGVSQIALGGICLALTVVFLFGGSFVPGIELTLYAISSLFIAVMIIESGIKGGISLYIAALLLGFLLIPNKLALLPYAFLFGLYGIVKFYIEKLKNPIGQIALKVLFFGSVLSVTLIFFRKLLLGTIDLPEMPVALLIAGGVLFLMLYDALYTFLINLYITRIKRAKVPKTIRVSKDDEE